MVLLKLVILAAWLPVIGAENSPTNSTASAQPKITIALSEEAAVTLGDPVLVAASTPGEKRWGYYQFPMLSRPGAGQTRMTILVRKVTVRRIIRGQSLP